MVDELQQAFDEYMQQWQDFAQKSQLAELFTGLKPIAVGWKVADQDEFNKLFLELQPLCDRISHSWLDDRWLGGFHTKESLLPHDVRHIKLMQRRPARPTDLLGLDHVDFLLPADVVTTIEETLRAHPDISWEREKGDLCEWISVHFDGKEAKMRFPDKTSLDAVIKEWQIIKQEVTA